MKALATLAATLALAAGCLWGADAIAKRLLLWLVMLLTLTSCTFALMPGEHPRIRICPPPYAWQCSPNYEWTDM